MTHKAWKTRDVVLISCLTIAIAGGTAAMPGVGAVVVAGTMLAAMWCWPVEALELGVILVLVVRPWADAYSERRFGDLPYAPNPAVIVGLVVLSIAAVTAIRRARQGDRIWIARGLGWAHVWLFLGYGVATLAGWRFYGGIGLIEGGRELLRVASIIAAFLVVLWWVSGNPRRYLRGWAYLLLGCIPPVCSALWQYVTGTGFLETVGLNRLQGTFSHPNSFGQYLVPFILLGVARSTGPRARFRAISISLTALLTWLVLMTYSRTVLLVLALALTFFVVLHARYRAGPKSLMWGGGLILSLIIAIRLLAGNVIRERFSNLSLGRSAVDAALEGESENSYEWRLVNWSVLISLGLEHPLVGHGAGMTTVLNPIVNRENGVPFNAHNDFVRFFFEGGFTGLICYTSYAIMLCVWAVQQCRRTTSVDPSIAEAVASSWLALLMLSGGNTELSLHTADLFALYGMLALVFVKGDGVPSSPLAGVRTLASGQRSF